MTTKIKTPGITDANVTTAKLDLISTSGTPGATIKGTSGQTDGYIQLNCSENSHGIKLKSPPHSAAQSYTLTFPQSITNGYFLKTDGSGNLSFAQVNDAATAPTITSFLPTTAEGGVNTSIVITGTNYVSTPMVEFQSVTDGSIQHAATVAFNSSTQLTIGTGTGLVNGTNYYIIVTNNNGQSVRSSSQLTTSAAPVWTTAETLDIGYAGAADILNFTNAFVVSGSDLFQKATPTDNAAMSASTDVVARFVSANPTAPPGGGEITIYLSYRIIDTA